MRVKAFKVNTAVAVNNAPDTFFRPGSMRFVTSATYDQGAVIMKCTNGETILVPLNNVAYMILESEEETTGENEQSARTSVNAKKPKK